MTTSGTPWSAARRASASSSPTAPHVVDQVRAGGERGLGDGGLGRVDAQRRVGQGRPEGRDDRHDPAAFLVLGDRGVPGPRRFATDVEDVGALLDHPAAGRDAPPSTGSPRRPPSRPSPENESGVTLRMPITNVRSPQAKVRGPIRVVPSPAAPDVRRSSPIRPPASARIAQVGIVDELATRHPDKIERTGDHDRARARAERAGRARAERIGSTRTSRGARGIARASCAASSAAGIARASVEARARRRSRPSSAAAVTSARDDAIDVLVRHRRGHERQRPVGAGTAAGRRARPPAPRPRPGCGRRRAGRRDRRRRMQLEPAGPDGGRVAAPAGRRRDRRDAGRLERVEQRVGDRGVGRLVAAAQADPRRSEARQLDLDPVAVPAEERRRLDLGQRHAEPPRAPADDRQPVTVARRSRPGRRAR